MTSSCAALFKTIVCLKPEKTELLLFSLRTEFCVVTYSVRKNTGIGALHMLKTIQLLQQL